MENLARELKILNISFYKFVTLNQLHELRDSLRSQCKRLNLKGTILISTEGMNGSLAGQIPHIVEFQGFLRNHVIGAGLSFKESYSREIPYKNLFIKIKKEIIPLGDSSIQPEHQVAPCITPRELKRWLDENREFELLDTRNEYEVNIGTFKKARHLNLKNFRQFPAELNRFPERSRDQPLVMFCTGGIRCEKAALVALKAGFKEVYQLEGGILKYFEECGDNHYEGECFVFDDRIAVNPQLKARQDLSEDHIESHSRLRDRE